MESETEKGYLHECSLKKRLRRLWLRMSRCESIEEFLSLLFGLERLLNSQLYSPNEIRRIIFPHFLVPISQSRDRISPRLLQQFLCRAVLTKSPYYRLRCSEFSREIAQFFSHRQISSSIFSSNLKHVTSDLNFKTVLAKCLMSRFFSRRALKPDNLINLKYLCNHGKLFYSFLKMYYLQRGVKSHLRKLSSFGDSRKSLVNRIGSNVRCEKTASQQLKNIFDFADRLSREILDDLHTPMCTAVELDFNNPCTTPSSWKVNHRHYHSIAVIENAAERLEQTIMREALISLHRLWYFQNHDENSLNTPSSQQIQSNSKLLSQFTNDIASQILKEASQSAEKRMSAIRRITDSILQAIPQVQSSNLKSVLINGPQRIPETEIPSTAAESNRRTQLDNFAGNLTDQCLSEVLQSLKKCQAN
nr:hypothetical protein HmN_000038300 [Hymenolepis microstoma]